MVLFIFNNLGSNRDGPPIEDLPLVILSLESLFSFDVSLRGKLRLDVMSDWKSGGMKYSDGFSFISPISG